MRAHTIMIEIPMTLNEQMIYILGLRIRVCVTSDNTEDIDTWQIKTTRVATIDALGHC